MKNKKSSVYQLTVCALMAAVMCVIGPMSIPIGAVPVSFTNFVICLTTCLLGWKWGSVSVIVYVLLGTFGVLALFGYSINTLTLFAMVLATGGYIIGYVFITLIGGAFIVRFRSSYIWTVIGLVLGVAVTYAFGTAWFVLQMKCELGYAITVCVLPFIGWDLLKICAATAVGATVRRALIRSHLIEDKYQEVTA